MFWYSVGKDLPILYQPSHSVAANRKKVAQEEEGEQPYKQNHFCGDQKWQGSPHRTGVLLWEQILLPLSLLVPMFPGFGNGLNRESSRGAPTKPVTVNREQPTHKVLRYVQNSQHVLQSTGRKSNASSSQLNIGWILMPDVVLSASPELPHSVLTTTSRCYYYPHFTKSGLTEVNQLEQHYADVMLSITVKLKSEQIHVFHTPNTLVLNHSNLTIYP